MSDLTTQKFEATGFDQYGKAMKIAPKWSVDGKGTVDADGLYTPAKVNGGGNWLNARFGVVASAGDIEGRGFAAVEEARRVAKLELMPAAPDQLKMVEGTSTQLNAEATDQFAARYLLPIDWSATGQVAVDQTGRVTAQSVGAGTITAMAGGQKISVPVQVLNVEDVNLAQGKSAMASSSINAGGDANFATDGNPKTRWESAHSDPQSITVDLESVYTLRKIALTWETAAAKTYQIELSTDGANWVSAVEIEDGKPGKREFELNGTKARYIRVSGTARTTGYGYSLYEIEAYGTK